MINKSYIAYLRNLKYIQQSIVLEIDQVSLQTEISHSYLLT